MNIKKVIYSFIIVGISALLFGCASPRPVFYDNAHYNSVGAEQAEKDANAAMAQADKMDLNSDNGAAASRAGEVTATSAVSGGAISAIRGGNIWDGLIVGTIWGGMVSMIHGIFGIDEPTPMYKQYVNTKLGEKGYQVLGWK